MVFCLDHSDSALEIADCLTEALTILGTPGPTKMARLYLVSDILHNSCSARRSAWAFRSAFEKTLPQIFEHFNESMQKQSRISQQKMKDHLARLLKVWDHWSVYSPSFTKGLEASCMHDPNAPLKPLIKSKVDDWKTQHFSQLEKACRQRGLRCITSHLKPQDGKTAEQTRADWLIERLTYFETYWADKKPDKPTSGKGGIPTLGKGAKGVGAIFGGKGLGLGGAKVVDDVDGEPLDDDVDGEPLDEDDIDGESLGESDLEEIDGAAAGKQETTGVSWLNPFEAATQIVAREQEEKKDPKRSRSPEDEKKDAKKDAKKPVAKRAKTDDSDDEFGFEKNLVDDMDDLLATASEEEREKERQKGAEKGKMSDADRARKREIEMQVMRLQVELENNQTAKHIIDKQCAEKRQQLTEEAASASKKEEAKKEESKKEEKKEKEDSSKKKARKRSSTPRRTRSRSRDRRDKRSRSRSRSRSRDRRRRDKSHSRSRSRRRKNRSPSRKRKGRSRSRSPSSDRNRKKKGGRR